MSIARVMAVQSITSSTRAFSLRLNSCLACYRPSAFRSAPPRVRRRWAQHLYRHQNFLRWLVKIGLFYNNGNPNKIEGTFKAARSSHDIRKGELVGYDLEDTRISLLGCVPLPTDYWAAGATCGFDKAGDGVALGPLHYSVIPVLEHQYEAVVLQSILWMIRRDGSDGVISDAGVTRPSDPTLSPHLYDRKGLINAMLDWHQTYECSLGAKSSAVFCSHKPFLQPLMPTWMEEMLFHAIIDVPSDPERTGGLRERLIDELFPTSIYRWLTPLVHYNLMLFLFKDKEKYLVKKGAAINEVNGSDSQAEEATGLRVSPAVRAGSAFLSVLGQAAAVEMYDHNSLRQTEGRLATLPKLTPADMTFFKYYFYYQLQSRTAKQDLENMPQELALLLLIRDTLRANEGFFVMHKHRSDSGSPTVHSSLEYRSASWSPSLIVDVGGGNGNLGYLLSIYFNCLCINIERFVTINNNCFVLDNSIRLDTEDALRGSQYVVKDFNYEEEHNCPSSEPYFPNRYLADLSLLSMRQKAIVKLSNCGVDKLGKCSNSGNISDLITGPHAVKDAHRNDSGRDSDGNAHAKQYEGIKLNSTNLQAQWSALEFGHHYYIAHRAIQSIEWWLDIKTDPSETVFVSKHLCGSAVDELFYFIFLLQGKWPKYLFLSTCCHNKCHYYSYINKTYLNNVLLLHNEEDFQMIAKRTCWLHQQSLNDVQRDSLDLDDTMQDESGVSDKISNVAKGVAGGARDWQYRSGKALEALLDHGRVQWLRHHGYQATLVHHVGEGVTPRSSVIVAKRIEGLLS